MPRICAHAVVPILAIRAERSILPEEAELRARFPSLKLDLHTIAGTGHHVHIDAPDAVGRLIRQAWQAG